MHKTAFLSLVLCVSLLFAAFFQTTSLAQGPNEGRLDDVLILFGTSNQEASPFDRTDAGASRLASLLGRAGADIRELNWTVPIPENTELVVLVAPQQDYAGAQVARLWAYIERGGSVLILADPGGARGALPQDTGLLELLWSDYGLRMNDVALVNPAGETPPPAPEETANAEGTPFPTPTPLPGEFPPQEVRDLSAASPDHPILMGVNVEQLVLDLVRPVETEPFVEGAAVTDLLLTGPALYGEADVATLNEFGVYLFDAAADTPQNAYLVAAAAENLENGARIVMIGDGTAATNGYGFSTSPPGSEAFVFPDLAQLVLNAAYWTLDQEPPIFNFDAPEPTATPTITPSPTLTPTSEGEG